MGEAKRRGTFEQRVSVAKVEAEITMQQLIDDIVLKGEKKLELEAQQKEFAKKLIQAHFDYPDHNYSSQMVAS